MDQSDTFTAEKLSKLSKDQCICGERVKNAHPNKRPMCPQCRQTLNKLINRVKELQGKNRQTLLYSNVQNGSKPT